MNRADRMLPHALQVWTEREGVMECDWGSCFTRPGASGVDDLYPVFSRGVKAVFLT